MKYPITPAVRWLREKKIEFVPHVYDYVEHGGTRHSAESLGVSEHAVVKTLVMETESGKPLIVLMHGDREVSTKNLARKVGVKSVQPCSPDGATKHTGYMVGGTSPFGTRSVLPVYAERTIFEIPKILINGGKRGFLVEIEPSALRQLSQLEEVQVAIGSDE
ncbi:MAG TPA: aminoacyl-tRNA deacylase [Pyrinomonadaceae bacterium]|nr:aminoacyl-tRNA deacylase [Pyrinomonadaceae bacterium]